MVAATFKLRKRRLIHKTQAKACGYQLQKEKITFDITKKKKLLLTLPPYGEGNVHFG